MIKKNIVENWKSFFALLAIYLGWGSTYLAIAIALEDFPPFILAGARFFLAGSILLIWCRSKAEKVPHTRDVLKISLAGIFLLLFGSGSVIWVEQYLSTGLTSIIWASLPIFLLAMDKKKWPFYLTSPKPILGLIIGFMGVMLLFWDEELVITASAGARMAFIVAISGVVCFSFGSLFMRYVKVGGTVLMKVAIQMFIVGMISLLIGLMIGEHRLIDFKGISLDAILGLAYLITVGSLTSYLAYIWLIGTMPPTIVGTYTYVNPVVAVVLGWYILDEAISKKKLLAMAIIFLGVLIVNFYKSKNENYDSKNVARKSAKREV